MAHRRQQRRRWGYRHGDGAAIEALQRRAEAMTRGDFSALGQPAGAGTALENLRRAIDVLGAHVEQGQRTMHEYIAALSTAQEAERGRIARDLHDDTVQQLIAIGQGIERAQRLSQRDAALAEARLGALRAEVTALVQAVRGIIADLRPPALDELGLLPAVELLIKRGADLPTVTLTVDGPNRRLDAESELALFRIIQEAWSNIHHHAGAKHVVLHFYFTRNALIVTIRDDGRGFEAPVSSPSARGRYGLLGMQERAALVGGTVTVQSQPGAGTSVEIRIPYLGLEGRDPVCGMTVGADAVSAEFENQLYRFCSEACRTLFLAQPQRYAHYAITPNSSPGAGAPDGNDLAAPRSGRIP